MNNIIIQRVPALQIPAGTQQRSRGADKLQEYIKLYLRLQYIFKQNVTKLQKQIKSSFCVLKRCKSIFSIKYMYTLIGPESDKLYETRPQQCCNFYNVLLLLKTYKIQMCFICIVISIKLLFNESKKRCVQLVFLHFFTSFLQFYL